MCNLQAKHLPTNAFKIYSASAGSGKTYQLTKAYLKLILSPNAKQKYRELLAITFTNKAVAEMKQRILESLYAFSKEVTPMDKTSLFNDICKEIQLTPKEIQLKSKHVLKELLHNYAFFEISTIDKFTHKIIRTFAHDLKISQNFDVVLDTDLLLEEAVSRILNKAGENMALTNILIDFSLEKIEDDKSWNIAYDLFEIGKLLFQENHATHIKKLGLKEISDFVRLQKTLKSKIENNKKSIKKIANQVLEIISANELEFSDFTRSSFPKFMLTLANGSFNVDFGANWKQNFAEDKLYNKNCLDHIKNKLDNLHHQFSTYFSNIKNEFHELSFLKNCYNNIVPLTVLNQIASEVQLLQKEKDILPISEFNSLIAKEIKNQPVPFIYERLGEKYRHYFIDEFQDTSQMQWQNLIPLIGNALESENEKGERGSLLIVGDGKQAIYRWRGGRAEQFLNLLNLKTNPFVITQQIENLDTNWRSKKEIISFNNSFFSFAAKKLRNNNYIALFEEGNKQKSTAKSNGYVEFVFLDKTVEVSQNLHCEKTLEILERALANGYHLRDVCIIVRDNKKGALIADFLTENEIAIISPDSLLLANNLEVSFLISLLSYIENSENSEAIYSILDYLHKKTDNKHDYISKHLTSLSTLLCEKYDFNIDAIKRLPIYDMLEQAISSFNLAGHSDAHLSHFMDEVFDFSQKEDSSIFSLLDFWNRKSGVLSVKAPESIDAVKIMTIHKAKGLEFPVVIFPYADSKIIDHRNKRIWFPVDKENYEGFNQLIVNTNKELENYNDKAEKIYNAELDKLELDSYNVLYVAMTRAKNALFVITDDTNTKDTYSELFIDYFKNLDLWDTTQAEYCFGYFTPNEKEFISTSSQENIPYIYSQKSLSTFKIVAKANMLWDIERQEAIKKGNLIHKVLSKIYTQNDIQKAIVFYENNGDIASVDAPFLKEKLEQVVFHSELSIYFKEELTVYNEKELLTPKGILLRPDRLVAENKNITIIDYKTGTINSSHKSQLLEYATVLKQMGYVIKDTILVYINDTVKPIFI